MKTELQSAIVKQLGSSFAEVHDLMATLNDIHSYGIEGGFGGFICYRDTVEFAEKNMADILDIARDMAEDLGVDGPYSLIADFACLGDGYTADSVADAINDRDHEDRTQVLNAMAWFAAEEFAHYMIEGV
jgi:hypothetical protein